MYVVPCDVVHLVHMYVCVYVLLVFDVEWVLPVESVCSNQSHLFRLSQ